MSDTQPKTFSRKPRQIATGVIAVASLLAAIFWFWSAQIEIPNNVDTFIEALRKASRLSGYAAASAGVAALGSLVLLWLDRNVSRMRDK
mgnify:CR=1 FL=1|tara:strand:- start:209 stop:475 length:267 start_codon:yes stop_codon:yes gene_type:complete